MAYKRSDMLYDDGKYYSWTAKADNDNPFIRGGIEHSQVNRTEGYEVLYFLNNNLNWPASTTTASFQKAEKMLRYHVPEHLHDRTMISNWIANNWTTYTL